MLTDLFPMRFHSFFLLLLSLVLAGPLVAADRPNILWITSEDNATQWIGCYGNPQASPPRIDSLAAGGMRDRRSASSNFYEAVCP
ncbi:MAG: hypothetical protein CFE26_05835 [Verrucomicrobiales bacterium VVV1]|nr:MAG: hypothetical protein CFE26_05835 [Verrucomicrobiales bacterium VVV1]